MTDLDDTAAVAAAKEGAGGVSQTAVPTETAQEEASGAPIQIPRDDYSEWAAIVDVLPEVVAEFCAAVIVPTLRNLLRPTLAIIDHSPADHSNESLALAALPEAVSTVIQQIGADHLALLLGAHLTHSAVMLAHAAAADPVESDAPVSQATGDYVEAVLREMIPSGEPPVTLGQILPEGGTIPTEPAAEPIAQPSSDTPVVAGL